VSEMQTKTSPRSPREVIAELFPSIGKELSISGGWGQDKENACVLEKEATFSIALAEWDDTSIEKVFVEKRIYIELIVMAPPQKRCSGIEWRIIGQEILHENSRVFEHLTFSVTALLDRDWDELKAEWEGPNGYGSDSFDLEGHLSKRADRTIRLQREFWFDITAWVDHSIYGLPLPLEIASFRRGHTKCYEMQSPGLGYSVAYNDSLNDRIATIYFYDFGMADIPACLTHPDVIEQFERSLSDVMGSDEALARKSELLRRFSMGDPTSGKGFLGAILSLTEEDRESMGSIFLTVLDGRFVKLRLPLPANDDAFDQTLSFVESVSAILWPRDTRLAQYPSARENCFTV